MSEQLDENTVSEIQESARTESEQKFNVEAWQALPFFKKIEAADKPLNWYVVMPSLLAFYGCMFYVIANSCVYYPEIVPVRAFLFQDVFMLALLILTVSGVLLSIGSCVFLYRFRWVGVKLAYAGFAVHGFAAVFWAVCMLITWKSFYGWGLLVCLLLTAFLGLVFVCNRMYFQRRRHLFI